MKKITLSLLATSLAACASTAPKSSEISANTVSSREPSNFTAQLPQVNLVDVISANAGYWSVNKKTAEFFGRYRAYIVSQPENDYHDLYVFAETEALESLPQFKNMKITSKDKAPTDQRKSDFNLIAKNSQFVWGGNMAGTEPVLTTNKKGSLVVETMNEAVGRSSWRQQVISRFNPESGKLEVIGFEYKVFDKLEHSFLECSFNFSTAVGIITIAAAAIDEDGNEIKPEPKPVVKKIKLKTRPSDLNKWSDKNADVEDCYSSAPGALQ